MPCIEFSDIVRSNEHQVYLLTEVAAQHPDPESPGASEAFSRQVRMVESVVVGTYVIAVEEARRTNDLLQIAALWKSTGQLCDRALAVVSELKDKYVHCGTPELYDRLLDYRNACSCRYDRVNEEILCQTMPTPEGLFPTLS